MTLPNGYELKTTFWDDFSIAEKFGVPAIKDTFIRIYKEWKDNIEYATELSIVMNLKCWEHYEKHNEKLSQLYEKYYYTMDTYILDSKKYNDKDKSYYLSITD